MHVFRSSRSQMLSKIGALKIFAIFWIKKSLQHRCFPVNVAKFLRAAFLQNFSSGCFCIFLKVINQLFRKGVNVNRFLKKCHCYYVLIIHQMSSFLNNSIRVCTLKLKVGMLYLDICRCAFKYVHNIIHFFILNY